MSAKRKAAAAASANGNDGPDAKRRKLPVSRDCLQVFDDVCAAGSGKTRTLSWWGVSDEVGKKRLWDSFPAASTSKALAPHQVHPASPSQYHVF